MDLWLVLLIFVTVVVCGLIAIVCALGAGGSYPTPPRKEESYGNNVRVFRPEDQEEGGEAGNVS